MSENIKEKIEASLNKIRPSLQMDGGDVELVDFDEAKGVVKVNMTGMCAGCPMAGYTLKGGIEEQLKQDVPEVKAVESV
jgi:Fe-S cluster biogenesis protein NfuA